MKRLELNEKSFQFLRKFNIVMGVLHLISGVLMVILSNDTTYAITIEFLKFDVEQNSIMQIKETLFDLPLGLAVSAFLFMSSLAHFVISTVYYKKYVEGLKVGVNFARWIEYAFSSSWMIVVIAILVGMYDAGALMLIFFLNMAMILFGYMMELHNRDKKGDTDWKAFWFGSLSGLIPWVVIGWYFIGAISQTNDVNPVPDFVYAILISLFLFFNIFAVNMYLQYKKIGAWKNYLYGEVVFIILSLVAKTLLAWQVWSGTLR